MKVTVAICTWNRASLLDQTLNHMRKIKLSSDVQWELLVVNNNSTDSTEDVIYRYQSCLPIRHLIEKKQGLSNARNCAIENADGELLVWTDDDVLVDPNWLSSYVDAARENPRFSFFGGTVKPWFACKPPVWVLKNLRNLEGPFALRQLGDNVRPLKKDEQVFGANMAVWTHLAKLYPYNPCLGRVGTRMLSGEESEVFARMHADGHEGLWVGVAEVMHFIPKDRMTTDFMWRYYHGIGQTVVRAGISDSQMTGPRIYGVPRWWYRTWLVSHAASYLQWLALQPWLPDFIAAAKRKGMIDECRNKLLHGKH